MIGRDWQALTVRQRRMTVGAACAVGLLTATALLGVGASWQRSVTESTPSSTAGTVTAASVTAPADDETLPRCAEDDYNPGADWCYTVTVDDQPVLLAPHDDGAYTIKGTQGEFDSCEDTGPGVWCQTGSTITAPNGTHFTAH